MWKLLLLFGLSLTALGVAGRKWFSDRALKQARGKSVSLTGKSLAKKLVTGAGLKTEVAEGRRSKLGEGTLVLSPAVREEKAVLQVAEAGVLAGLVMLGRRQEQLLGWREWGLKFGWAAPAFTMVVVVFAIVVGKLPMGWGLGVISVGLGLGVLASALVAWVEWQAVGLVAKLTEARAVFHREEERVLVLKTMRGLAAKKLVPGFLAKFLF